MFIIIKTAEIIEETQKTASDMIIGAKSEGEKIILDAKEEAKNLLIQAENSVAETITIKENDAKIMADTEINLIRKDFETNKETLNLLIKRNTPKVVKLITEGLNLDSLIG